MPKGSERQSLLKIKVAYLIPTLSLGGAEKQQINILNGIDTDRFEVRLYVLKSRAELQKQIRNHEVEVMVCGIDSLWCLGGFLRFFLAIRRFGPDVIHSHMFTANMLARVLKLWLPKAKIINHFHGLSAWLSGSRLSLDRLSMFLVERFIVVSKTSMELRLYREGYSREKTVLLPNSVEIPDLNRVQAGQNKVLGMASRLIKLKNIDAVLHLMVFLKAHGLAVQLRIAGEGPERAALESLADSLGIGKEVTFLGLVNEMDAFYESVDLFCIASSTEDMPLTMIEAMAYGRPIIAARVGGIPDILEPLACALLVDDFQTAAQREAILRFISGLDSAVCTKTLHRYANEHFGNEHYCMRLGALYTQLMEA